MAQRSLARRVEILEEKVASLEELPERVARIESQILQFREENRAEHSAIRTEIRAGDEETRRFAKVLHDDLLAKLSADNAATRQYAQTLHDEVVAKLDADNQETRHHMRVLYEDLVARIAVLGEAHHRPRKRR